MCTYPDLPAKRARKKGCKCARCREYDRLRQQLLLSKPGVRARVNFNQRLRRQKPEVAAKDRAYKAKRRAKYSTGVRFLTEEEKILTDRIYAEARRLTKETGIAHHVDHIIPLAHGGTHHPDNLQILTSSQNVQKGIKIMYADETKVQRALRKIVEQYGRVLEALATGNRSLLGARKRRPTLWD